jgi:hypothetical protein
MLIKLSATERSRLARRLERRGVNPARRFALRQYHDVLYETLADLGHDSERRVGQRAEPPSYTELGMERVAGEPTEEEAKAYYEITAGGQLGEGSYVTSVLLTDSDLITDRYSVFSYQSLVGLMSRYLGRANDYNHSFDQKDAAGRLIDVSIGMDPGVVLHPDHPTDALRTLAPLNAAEGNYLALYGVMAFPGGEQSKATIEGIKSGLVRDVSIAWSCRSAVCSACLKHMERFWFWNYCEQHGLPGGRLSTGEAIVAIFDGITDAFVFGNVSDGAVKRARYVPDPKSRD